MFIFHHFLVDQFRFEDFLFKNLVQFIFILKTIANLEQKPYYFFQIFKILNFDDSLIHNDSFNEALLLQLSNLLKNRLIYHFNPIFYSLFQLYFLSLPIDVINFAKNCYFRLKNHWNVAWIIRRTMTILIFKIITAIIFLEFDPLNS